MTQADYEAFIASNEYPVWQELRGKIERGEPLTEAETVAYAAIKDKMDAQEKRMLDRAVLLQTSELRRRVASLEAEAERLREQRLANGARIRALEAQLDAPIRKELDALSGAAA
jgi:uncharacterized small protein (DUF1192 family)